MPIIGILQKLQYACRQELEDHIKDSRTSACSQRLIDSIWCQQHDLKIIAPC